MFNKIFSIFKLKNKKNKAKVLNFLGKILNSKPKCPGHYVFQTLNFDR